MAVNFMLIDAGAATPTKRISLRTWLEIEAFFQTSTRVDVITGSKSEQPAMHILFANAMVPWFASTMLAFEAIEVIRLRLAKLASVDADAGREARLMVSEKVDAIFEASASLMFGATPASVVGRYREHVAANARRLSAA